VKANSQNIVISDYISSIVMSINIFCTFLEMSTSFQQRYCGHISDSKAFLMEMQSW